MSYRFMLGCVLVISMALACSGLADWYYLDYREAEQRDFGHRQSDFIGQEKKAREEGRTQEADRIRAKRIKELQERIPQLRDTGKA